MIVTVYESTTCPDCAKLRHWLDSKGVDYTGLLVDKNPYAANKLTLLKERATLPITTIEDDEGNIKSYIGYCPEELEVALGLKKKAIRHRIHISK